VLQPLPSDPGKLISFPLKFGNWYYPPWAYPALSPVQPG
jgi:hypothetical protein